MDSYYLRNNLNNYSEGGYTSDSSSHYSEGIPSHFVCNSSRVYDNGLAVSHGRRVRQQAELPASSYSQPIAQDIGNQYSYAYIHRRLGAIRSRWATAILHRTRRSHMPSTMPICSRTNSRRIPTTAYCRSELPNAFVNR